MWVSIVRGKVETEEKKEEWEEEWEEDDNRVEG